MWQCCYKVWRHIVKNYVMLCILYFTNMHSLGHAHLDLVKKRKLVCNCVLYSFTFLWRVKDALILNLCKLLWFWQTLIFCSTLYYSSWTWHISFCISGCFTKFMNNLGFPLIEFINGLLGCLSVFCSFLHTFLDIVPVCVADKAPSRLVVFFSNWIVFFAFVNKRVFIM